MSTFDEVFERIKMATNTRTQVELAEVLDIRQSSISDAKRRNSVPSDWYMKLFEKFGLNPDWLKMGSGPMYLRTEQGYQPVDGPAAGQVFEDPAKYGDPDAKSSVVTVYAMHDNQADKNELPSKGLSKLSVPQSFAGPSIQVFKVEATSMEPLISKGAFVGLDTQQKSIMSGELYGVFIPYEGIAIRRIYLDAQNQRFILRSENPALPEQFLPLGKHQASIVGRVTWVLQKM
ncbi:LexA family transcriptional regulator [Oleidesulfovibrio sp.]|uniref:LexA family transcriptional regulator n=1 Tax=Oleidesulfovibrio sp. TaxID=2909707 RepID=UPI003A8AB5D9